MFPFDKSGVLSFEANKNQDNNPINYANQVEQDVKASTSSSLLPLHYHGQLEHNNFVARNCHNTRKGRQRKSQIGEEFGNNKEDECNGDDVVAKKRIMHREIERQRRQEMANLHSSLRSLLPVEYIKGKRSICDHIGEAARYIKDLERNVKELGDKRDSIKEWCSSGEIRLSGDCNFGSCNSSSCSWDDCNVSIHTFSSSLMEIEISVGIGDEDSEAYGFPLSRVLMVLIEEGLGVVNCLSSKVNRRWIYEIHCEVNDGISIDSNQLERRLISEIRSYET